MSLPIEKLGRLARYLPLGDGPVRDSAMRVLDVMPEEDRLGAALAIAVIALDSLERTGIGPVAKNFAAANADAVGRLIPEHIGEVFPSKPHKMKGSQ